MLKAQDLLPTEDEVRSALGPEIYVELVDNGGTSSSLGEVVRAAARDLAFRRFSGTMIAGDSTVPMEASAMALLFDTPEIALRTFSRVAQAAHLRTPLEECTVAVETVTAPSGLVNYWGFIHKGAAIVVLTLSSLDPQRLSVGDLRSLATVTAQRLNATNS